MNNLAFSKPGQSCYSTVKPRLAVIPYSEQDSEGALGFYELLNKNLGQTMGKRFKRRGVRKWFLAFLFLTAFCLATLDSNHFEVFILTKIVAAFLFVLAYSESKGFWKETDKLPVKYRHVERPTIGSNVKALRFFEK